GQQFMVMLVCILGVNHFLDMCRTALNVTGDLVLTTLVVKGEE
ncbi:cation:dicarboxylate symporter family transporter, partial [Xanthomonas fragariae]